VTARTRLPLSLFTTWLARGERGLSSESIVEAVTGERIGRYERGVNHPHDPGDLRRCILLIEHVPLVALVFKDAMRDKSPEWKALVAAWDDLVALFREEEAENTGRAPRTYALMREMLEGARSQP
jgi:hypothetical protein